MALLNAAKPAGKLEKVYADVDAIRKFAVSDSSFKLFLESPGIKRDQKQNVVDDICKATKADDLTKNFLSLLIENKRLASLEKIVDIFEELYRKELGQVMCTVTSASELSVSHRKQVEEAIAVRMKGKKLVVNFDVSCTILGGLLVKVEDQVLDFSVASKLDRLKTQLLQPMD